MKQHLLLLFFLTIAPFLCAQTLTAKFIGESRHVDSKANHYAATSDGGFIIAGNTTANGNADAYLWKVDSLGQTQWFKTYGHTGEENGTQVLVCADGGYLLGGNTAVSTYDTKHPFIKKTDAAGNVLWDTQMDHQQSEIVSSMIERPNGGWVAFCTNALQMINLPAHLVSLSADGTLVKDETFDGDSGSLCNAADGGYFWARNFNYLTQIRRYNADQTLRWTLNTSNPYGGITKMMEGTNGNLYFTQTNLNGINLIQYLDPLGFMIWERTFYGYLTSFDGIKEYAQGKLEFYILPGAFALYYGDEQLVKGQIDPTVYETKFDTITIPQGLPKNMLGLKVGHNRVTCIANGQRYNNVFEVINVATEIYHLDITDKQQAVVEWRIPFVLPQEYGNERLIFFRKTVDGGYWLLAQAQHPHTGDAHARLIRTDSLGNEGFSATLPLFNPNNVYYWVSAMETLADNGVALAYVTNDSLFLRKYSTDGTLEWNTLVDVRGSTTSVDDIVLLPDGGFALYSKDFVANSSSWIYRLDKNGRLKTVRRLYAKDEFIIKMVALPNDGYLFFSTNYNNNIYLSATDLNGTVLWKKDLDVSCATWQINHFIRTSDGGYLMMVLCQGFEYASATWLKLNARYEQEWAIPAPEFSATRNPIIAEIPCKGFVSRLRAIYFNQPTLDHTPTVFSHINPNGKVVQQDSILYLPDVRLSSPDFVPGYSFAYWEDVPHGASRDLLLVRGAFPSVATTFPTNQLSVAPNPSSTLTCIGFANAYLGTVSVQLFDAKGALVQSFTEEKTGETWQKVLNGSDLRSGLYIVRVTAGEEVLMGKWVKG